MFCYTPVHTPATPQGDLRNRNTAKLPKGARNKGSSQKEGDAFCKCGLGDSSHSLIDVIQGVDFWELRVGNFRLREGQPVAGTACFLAEEVVDLIPQEGPLALPRIGSHWSSGEAGLGL